jgi:molybdopterin-guanine dinucleotide biosynthesis protein A
MSACGIVLAGGRGTRLGAGVPKARAVVAGATLAERAVATLAAACGEVVVAAPADVDPGAPHGARRVTDAAGHAGPLAGLVAALEACDADVSVVLGVDFPLVTPALVNALAGALAAARGVDAVVPRPGGTAQPLVAAYARTAAAPLRAALEAGVTSLRGGIGRLAVEWLDDAAIAALPGGADALLNVNAPADRDVAERVLRARGAAA